MNAWAYGPNLVCGWGGHSIISLPDRFACTVHIYNFVRDFVMAFFKDFPVGGGGIFEKGPFCEIIYSVRFSREGGGGQNGISREAFVPLLAC